MRRVAYGEKVGCGVTGMHPGLKIRSLRHDGSKLQRGAVRAAGEADEITAYGEFLTIAYGEANEIVITRVDSRAITTEGRYHLPVSAEEVYVPFNLVRPIEAQLKRAKRLLGELQADFKRKHPERSVSKRKRASLYRTYLQLLDAEEAGASEDEMAALFPEDLKKKGSDLGKAVKYSLAAAKRLRDGDYLYLLL